ncbi:MAG: PD-(D/E)XK nuclease family protein, partial [Candidatus Sifarchaeia archaeon]
MPPASNDILRRDFQHGKVAYGFQWNTAHHKELGHTEGDLASLWAHLNSILTGNVPANPFSDPFYTRASRLRFTEMSKPEKIGLRKKLKRTGALFSNIEDALVNLLRDYHRSRNDLSYCADHSILKEFILNDPHTIAIEVPVWSERYKLTGHVDIIRYNDGFIQVCDYKPGPMDQTKNRFMESIPQVSAYGEMLAHHLANTLRSAFEAPLLPRIRCCIFDTHSCWH